MNLVEKINPKSDFGSKLKNKSPIKKTLWQNILLQYQKADKNKIFEFFYFLKKIATFHSFYICRKRGV